MELVIFKFWNLVVKENLRVYSNILLTKCEKTAEARLHALISPCGICSGQSGTGTVFSPTSSVFPCQYHSAGALHSHISSGG
jgi:hypothetical protein